MRIQNTVCLKAFQVPLCLYEKAGHAGRRLITAVPGFDSHWDSENAFVIFLSFFSQPVLPVFHQGPGKPPFCSVLS